MKDLLIEKTYSTPTVHFDSKTGLLKIEGRSIPENPSLFYDQVVNWVNEYFNTLTNISIRLDIKLDYINSGSSKAILSLLKNLKNHCDNGKNCQVNWHFEEDDESIRDLGKHFKSVLKMSFNLVEIY